MRAVLLCFVAVFAAVALAGEAPDCHQQFTTIFSEVYPLTNNCSYVHIVPGTGQIDSYTKNLQLCLDVSSPNPGVARTCYSPDTRMVYYTSARGKYVWAGDVIKGAYTVFANLPAAYNYTLGVVVQKLNGVSTLFYVTTSSIYTATAAGQTVADFMPIDNLELSPDAIVTGDSNGNLIIVDGVTFWTINTNTKATSGGKKIQGLSQAQDLQWYPVTSSLLIVDSDQLFTVNPSTGASTSLIKLNAGTAAYGRVNSIDGTFFYYSDLVNIYKVNLAGTPVARVQTTPFDYRPVQGNIIYFN